MSENVVPGENQEATPPVVNQEGEQGHIPEPEKTVPLAALEDERRKRQMLEREAEIYRRKAEILEQGVQHNQRSEPEYDPDDVPSFKDVEKMLKEREASLRNENRQTQIALMVQDAKRKYNDYDHAYELAMKLVEQNPGAAEVIMASANPAEAVYHYGKTHPEFMAKSQSQVVNQVVDQINQNVNSPKTLSDSGGGGQPTIEKDWKKASTAEINAELERLRRMPR